MICGPQPGNAPTASLAGLDPETMPLFDEPFWIVYHRTHPFASKRKIELDDLADENLLLLADLHATSLETLIHLVTADFGVTLVPALAKRGTAKHGAGHDKAAGFTRGVAAGIGGLSLQLPATGGVTGPGRYYTRRSTHSVQRL